MIVLISGGCDPGTSVRAVTVTRLVIGVPEFVMNAFSPSITHSPAASSSTARVRVPPASLPGLGLGEAEAAEGAARAQVGQPLLALLLGAEDEDRVGAEADAGLERDRHRLVDPAELLDGHAQRGEVAAAPAVLLGEGQAEQARARPWRGRCRPGRCGRGPRPRRAARSRCARSPAPPCGTTPAPRSARSPSHCDLLRRSAFGIGFSHGARSAGAPQPVGCSAWTLRGGLEDSPTCSTCPRSPWSATGC